MSPSPLGEILRRARTSKGVTFEDAERVTRIPRKYLEALELENFGILPAPVYARGFLRSYAGYLGLDAAELLPFFPVGHVDEPKLDPLPQVHETHTWNANSLIGIGVVAFLVLLVIALYSLGNDSGGPAFVAERAARTNSGGVIVPPGEAGAGHAAGPAVALPDMAGQSVEDAIATVDESGASFILIYVREGDVPSGQVIDQEPAPGAAVGPGDLVTIKVSR